MNNFYFHHVYFNFNNTKHVLSNDYNIVKKYIDEHIPDNVIYKFWTLNDAMELINEHYPYLSSFFKSNHTYQIIKCDIFRYILMYHFGGIYTDLDFICIKSLGELLDKIKNNDLLTTYQSEVSSNIILSEEWEKSTTLTNTLHNGILISRIEKHPFWLKLIHEIYNDLVITNTQIISQDDVFLFTGTKKIFSFFQNNKHHFKDISILPYYYFCPYLAKNNTNDSVIKCDGINEVPSHTRSTWYFANINNHSEMKQLFPLSYFACISLNTGSMWK